MTRAWLVLAGCVIWATPVALAMPQVVTHAIPVGEVTMGNYWVTVNGQDVPVHRAIQNDSRVNDDGWDLDYGDYGFVSFDFSGGPVELRIVSRTTLDQAVIRPLTQGVKPEFPKPDTALIRIDKPGQYSFEPNGPYSPLLIFANAPEPPAPKEGDPGVVYFGPGLHRPPGGIIRLTDNQTLYLHGGAVVQAGLRIDGRNIKVRGRGILDGSPWTWRKGPLVEDWSKRDAKGRVIERGHMNAIQDSYDVSIKDITVRGAWQWTFYLENSEKVSFDNVKIVGGKNHNDDGIDPTNSRNITVRNCFIRTADDCFALKGHNFKDGPVEHLLVENCVLWTEAQRIALLGHESSAPAMRDIVFRDIDVIHFGPNIGFCLQPGEEMMLEDVLFENIRIHADGYVGRTNPAHVIDVAPVVNKFMQRKVPGHVRAITFRNISVTGPEKRKREIRIAGVDQAHASCNITLENVSIFGVPATRDAPFVDVGPNTSSISFKR